MTGKPEGLFELRRTRNQAVILLVSIVDRRIVPALQIVSRLGCGDSRALHVSGDAEQTRRLATDWMNLGLSWLPLHIHEPKACHGPIAVRDAVDEVARKTAHVTVVMPELDVVRWWYPRLYGGGARRIAEQLHTLPGVTAVIVPFHVRPYDSAPRRDTQDVAR